jgi:leucyl-tRNA synthetase
MRYPFKKIELKWKKYWEQNKIYKFNPQDNENKCYCLVMFPYPSSDKLHLGHWFNYAPADTWARFKRLNGFNVFHPMGFDAFGLPAENYAIKTGVHPQDTTSENVKFIRNQLKEIGAMYDWDYEVNTSDPDYYKWTQWLFLQFYKNDLVYRDKAQVNWCPGCQTVLANEQVVNDGYCERCDSMVERKFLTQWFFKITAYAEKLLEGIEKINWPEKTKVMQKNWIGKSYGLEIDFTLDTPGKETIKVFTTRPDTLFGATYLVLAPEYELVETITIKEQKEQVTEYINNSSRISEIERSSTIREKTGVFTGAYAINPVNHERIPVWIADYVLITYGTGAIMAVPAHDERDFEFARKFNLPIRKVILEEGMDAKSELKCAFVNDGIMINSAKYSNLTSDKGKEAISDDLEKEGVGKRTIHYKFRDWLISRQRYWGVPIPIIYCTKCGEQAVPEKDLPVMLPYQVDFKPKGIPPLATSEEFVNTSCPQCGGIAKREVDTMDTFVDSSWYFIRYLCNRLTDRAWDNDLVKKWLPVDQYIGGVDHATMHLLYARFFIMALYDIGLLPFSEPFQSLVHQGIIKGPDGMRMSKSRGNVINPEKYIEKYGCDVFRCYLMFGFEFIMGGPWDDSGIAAIDRFLNRIWRIINDNLKMIMIEQNPEQVDENEKNLARVMHNSIKGVTIDTERFHFNTAISRIMELVNELYRYTGEIKKENQNTRLLKEVFKNMILLIAPFAPHLAEELWQKIGEKASIFKKKWPLYDQKVLERDIITWVIQINGKIRERAEANKKMKKEELEQFALKTGRIPELLKEKQVKKVIIVPGKLINIVTN